MAATDRERGLHVTTPFGSDLVVCASVSGHEALSELFEYQLTLLSENGALDSDQILGQAVDVEVELPESHRRWINGVVTDFAQVGYGLRYHKYRATLRPWFWFLSRTADCRVFQNVTVPEIFEAVVAEYRFRDYELRLSGDFPAWEYCVQYRETDFNFLSRLLEQEGVYYFFEHQRGRHVLVLVDDPTAHESIDGYDAVPYYPPSTPDAQRARDYLESWSLVHTIQPGLCATTDFDFEQPRKSLLGKAAVRRNHEHADFEIFDYPAELQVYEARESERVSQVRLNELQSAYAVASGDGNAAGLQAGFKFTLEQYPRDDLNIEYLVTRTQISVSAEDYETASAGNTAVAISIRAIDARAHFRPPRVSLKPVVQGAQTAMVVGKSGEEIWTDEYGRVKVQFHWDRYGKRDETSSCWVRVAQVWAGEQWGAIHVPRIGQEVIVSFLEGDPDQPIITGRVYNGIQKPPYKLPDNATQSGFKSRSSKSGTADNFNELRFEDRKGEEEIYIHAERNLTAVVENDQTRSVGNDETVSVDRDRKASVGNDETSSVGRNRTENVGANDKLQVGKTYILEVGDSITLRTGSSQLIMKKDGTITLKGVKITVDGSQSIVEKAGQKIEVKAMQISAKGTKTEIQGTMLDLKASAVATLKGSLTKIG